MKWVFVIFLVASAASANDQVNESWKIFLEQKIQSALQERFGQNKGSIVIIKFDILGVEPLPGLNQIIHYRVTFFDAKADSMTLTANLRINFSGQTATLEDSKLLEQEVIFGEAKEVTARRGIR